MLYLLLREESKRIIMGSLHFLNRIIGKILSNNLKRIPRNNHHKVLKSVLMTKINQNYNACKVHHSSYKNKATKRHK